MAEQRLPKTVIHQFVPLDVPRFVKRFYDHWRPDLALFVESDLWPNLILGCGERKIPMILVNGRLSQRSFETGDIGLRPTQRHRDRPAGKDWREIAHGVAP